MASATKQDPAEALNGRNGTGAKSTSERTRLSLLLDPQSNELLDHLARTKHARKNEVIKNALRLYAFLSKETEGDSLPVVEVNGKSTLLP